QINNWHMHQKIIKISYFRMLDFALRASGRYPSVTPTARHLPSKEGEEFELLLPSYTQLLLPPYTQLLLPSYTQLLPPSYTQLLPPPYTQLLPQAIRVARGTSQSHAYTLIYRNIALL
ncbi:MAG: hypothetical protein LBM62_07330, partial [Mediterranea sp.]|nr:hypothetical protein [Mediterranea sp.]